MARTPADLQRLATRVTSRRTELHLSRDECARRARMSNTTWRRVEEGLPTRDTTYARVDEVLDWPPGTSAAILDGDESAPVPGETSGGVRFSRPPLTEDALRGAITDATIATLPDLTGAQIRALQEQAVEEARRRGLLD
ncbi:hypothetical protein [Peterkaempfera sp. SMS 1(5)a]|uniref:hypothetical protein n=1 Tax=Peterkaempfera podocarpi TaxID=3232308 RepID=UPI00366FB6DA